MQGNSKPIHLLREDLAEDCHAVASSSWGHLWQAFSCPLMRHWLIYDFLLTLFFTVVLALLFNNFV